jgi:hypothetical protein
MNASMYACASVNVGFSSRIDLATISCALVAMPFWIVKVSPPAGFAIRACEIGLL